MLLRYREIGRTEGLPDNAVRIKVYLPVVVIVYIGPDCQHRTCKIELKDFHVGSRVFQNMGDLRKMLLQQPDGICVISPVIQLSLEINAPVRICGEILDISRKDPEQR